MNVYIKNAALSRFGKQDCSVLDLSAETCEKALSGTEREKVDALVISSFAPEKYTEEYHLGAKLADRLRLKDIFCLRSETASSSGASAVILASNLIQSGRFSNVLVVGTEIMSRLDREKNNILLGSVLSETQRGFAMSMAQGAAMITRLYLRKYNYNEEDLFYIAEKLHLNGSRNPIAHIQKPITREMYNAGPKFATPLGLYDISPLSDGSAALLLSSEKCPLKILGTGYGTAGFSKSDAEPSFSSSVSAFSRAFSEAGILPSQIHCAELHDAFTTFELIGAEDAGLFPRGEALRAVIEGHTHPDSIKPINASGGLKTRGHPIGASGTAQIAELFSFMQKKKLQFGLTHSIGGLATNNFAVIMENCG